MPNDATSSGHAHLWEDKQRTEAQEAITRLLGAMKGRGWSADLSNTIDLVLLSEGSREYISQREVMETLRAMKDKGVGTLDEFVDTYHALKVSKANPVATWRFCIPLTIKLGTNVRFPRMTRILGETFYFGRWRHVQRRIGRKRILDALRASGEHNIPKLDRLCASIRSEGEDCLTAWQEIDAAFDAFRGILELAYGFGRWQVGSSASCRGMFPSPIWFVAHSEDHQTEVGRFITEQPESGPRQVIDSAGVKRFRTIAALHAAKPKPGTLVGLLADCLRLYVQAMDTPHRNNCLLGFWQLAETITLSDLHGGKTDTVCKRLASTPQLWRVTPSGLQTVLTIIANKRNDIVHRGLRGKVTDDHVNILKLACESALSWLSSITGKLPTIQHLENLYRYRDVNEASLASLVGTLAYIRQQRNR